MFEKLLPSSVVVVESRSALWDEPLLPAEAASLGEVPPERHREFAAGRACARHALALLGVEGFPIVAGADRVPIWPPGFTGSITHCAGFAVAAVARTETFDAVGVDVETAALLDERTLEVVCTASERAAIARAPTTRLERGVWAKVFYSAKETAYKCAYTCDRVFLDYHDLEVSVDPDSGEFDVVVTPAAETGAPARHVRGKFVVESGYVAAAAVIPVEGCDERAAGSSRGASSAGASARSSRSSR